MYTSISAFVLSGGFSRRFGTNKSFHQFKGQSLIRYPLELLENKFSIVSIVTKNPSDYHWLGYPVVQDVTEQQIPLVGLVSGLIHSKTDWNYFQACDMPFMQPGILDILTEHLKDLNCTTQALLPVTDQGIQPLAGFYHKNAIGSINKAVRQHLPVKRWVVTLNPHVVNFGGALSFQNVNTIEDLHVNSA